LAFIGPAELLCEKGSILERDRHQPLQGLKPDFDFIGFIGTTEQAGEKLPGLKQTRSMKRSRG
jgi:hypothetical protein